MIYTLQISEAAREDFLDSFHWYESVRLGLGEDFELCLEAALESVSRSPKHCAIRYGNIRVKFTERFPFGIHYWIENDLIRVIGIYHSSRDPQIWQDRI